MVLGSVAAKYPTRLERSSAAPQFCPPCALDKIAHLVRSWVVLQELGEDRKSLCRGLDYATTQKTRLRKITRSLTDPLGTSKTCPFRIIFMISYPLIVRLAVWKDPNPMPGLTNRLSKG